MIVYQNPDPKDPAKPAIGLLIRCAKLNLEQSAAGSVMKCTGVVEVPAEVHFEGTSLYGPIIDIDQPNNTVKVDGRGKLRMASGADLTAAFAAADLSSAAFASATGAVFTDPFPAGSPRPVLADDEWISLQGICAE